MRVSQHYNSNAEGFSLIEILVSLVISLLILGGAITIMINNQRHYRENDDFGRLQENARFALNLITGDIRLAGYWGCRITSPNNLLNAPVGTLLAATDPIDGMEQDTAFWSRQGSAEVGGMILAGTDAITIRRARNRGAPIVADMAGISDPITASNAPFANGQLGIIYNCDGADVFQSQVAGNTITYPTGAGLVPGNINNALSTAYKQSETYLNDPAADPQGLTAKTYVAAFDAVRYFVGLSVDNPNGRPVLWRQYHDGTGVITQELVEGVDNMQILYGEDNNDDDAADNFLNANAVADWDNVVAVKVTLLVSTVDEYGAEVDTRTYDVYSTPGNTGDDIGNYGDRRSRRLVTASVLMRNLQFK